MLDRIALILSIIGGLNWGLIGIFDFNLVTWLSMGSELVERIVYIVVALSSVWCISLLFRAASSDEGYNVE